MTWKNGRRLATFTNGDVSASFDYDADGLRTTKTVGTSRVDYYRAGGLLLGEVHTDGDESYTINYMYDESGRMLGFRLDGAEYYYVRDYSGDVTGLINARGELIGSYLYDPWGVLLETYLNTFEEETAEWTDADRVEYMRVLNLNPIRYKSYYYDTETEFYYLQSRYYDPITTRFINADGVVSGVGGDIRGYNMFVYCMNNPINMADDTGDFPFFLITAAIGAVVGAAVGGVIAAKTGKNVWAGIGIGAAAGGLIGAGVGIGAGAALAGSMTASAASVAIGAKALTTTIGSAGLVAGTKMIADNISQACNKVPQVFWSGGDVAKNTASKVASDIGGKTLEMTRLGAHLEQSQATSSAWQAASSNFANVASNIDLPVYSIQSDVCVRINSIWAQIEYPLLQNKDIVYAIPSQNELIKILP